MLWGLGLLLIGLVASTTPAAALPSASPSGSASASPPASSSRATFGVGPATQGSIDQRGFFSYLMGVGGVYNDQAAVVNYGSTPLTLSVFAADLGNGDGGSVAVGLQGQPTNDAGGWVQLPAKNLLVTVPARGKAGPGRVIVPFRITVPMNAAPGDHGAAIVAVLSTLGKNPKGENVRLDQRLASRIYLRVNGPLHPGLKIENLSVSYQQSWNPLHGGTATVRYTVHNVGNVRLSGRQAVSVTGLFGTKSKVVTPADLQLLFPGGSAPVTVRVNGVFPALFERSRVTVTPSLFSDQRPMPVPIATASRSFTAVPWLLIAAVLLLALLVLLIWWLRRRAARRPPRGGRHGRSGPVITPSPKPRNPETIAS